jgi:predicted CopG family antitoxin
MTETTTIRVSKQTAKQLERIRERIQAQSIDETIQSLIKKRRKEILEKSFGIDKGTIKPFTEEDRGEVRD